MEGKPAMLPDPDFSDGSLACPTAEITERV